MFAFLYVYFSAFNRWIASARSVGTRHQRTRGRQRRGKQTQGSGGASNARLSHYHTRPTRHISTARSAGVGPPLRASICCPAGHARARHAKHIHIVPGRALPDAARFEHVWPSLARACNPIQSDWFNGQRSEPTPSSADVRWLTSDGSSTAAASSTVAASSAAAATSAASSTSAALPAPQASGVINRSRRLSL